MELKSIKPAHGGFAHGGNILKYLVLSDTFVLQARNGVESIKDIPVHCPRQQVFMYKVKGSMLRIHPTNCILHS